VPNLESHLPNLLPPSLGEPSRRGELRSDGRGYQGHQEILREEFMRPLGISISALARDIGVPANRISQIVNGKRAISADTALRLGKYFGVSPEIWLDLQSEYELRLALRTTWKLVEPCVRTRVA
jgi:addiction module HigA family antidote